MGTNEYKEDLEFLYTALLNHPAIISGEKKKEELDALYLTKVDEVQDYSSFIDAATELTTFFQDGHTNIELPYTPKDLCLNLKCCWAGVNFNELILQEEYEDIPKYARITSVEEMSIEELIMALAERISHENLYLVKSRMIRYPYKNYHLFSEMNLRRLFGAKVSYTITFTVDGKRVKKDIPLLSYDGFLEFIPDEQFLSYEIIGDTAIMHLNSCICNEEYKRTLRELAYICNTQNINTFVLDLSENMGGNSSVIDEFIKYTQIKEYQRYEMVDYSSGEARIVTNRVAVVENQQQDFLLPKRIYCKVSHNTFSSARTFAVTLKDNGIAIICGVPSGGKPNSYGMPKKMTMPKTNIRFRVSRACFLRPDASRDEEIALMPEIEIELLTEENLDFVRMIQRDDVDEDFVDSVDTIYEIHKYGIIHNYIGHTYVIKCDSVYIGILLLGEALEWDTDPKEMKGVPFYRLMGFAIDKRYRGKGIGSYVLEKAIADCYQEFGVRPIVLGVHKDNHKAADFYLRNGFVKKDVMEGNDYYFLRYPKERD